MSVEEALSDLEQVSTFDGFAEKLLRVYQTASTRDEIEELKPRLEEIKARLMEANPEFRAAFEARASEQRRQSDEMRAEYNAKMREAEDRASQARMMADHARARAKAMGLQQFADSHLVKHRGFTEAERALEDRLGCPNPKCPDHGRNRKNMINGVPTCTSCMHRLVPRSEYGNYNRKYWRRYNKSRKK